MRPLTEAKIDTPAARARLTFDDHRRTLVPGKTHLVYRKREGQAGQWLVRHSLGAKRYRVAMLGIADDTPGGPFMSYAEAQSLALAGQRPHGRMTVADAIADHVAWLKMHRATGAAVESRAAIQIIPQIGHIKLSELTTEDLNRWRDRLAAQPAMLRGGGGRAATTPDQIRARRATVNRVLTDLKAALNRALANRKIDDDKEWRHFKPFPKTNARRPGFLSVAEAQRLINACDPEFRPLVQAGLLTGMRYGELCAMRVRDFQRGKIYIEKSKSGKPRDVVLNAEGVAFFAALVIGRTSDAPMFVRSSIGANMPIDPWTPSMQQRPMAEACKKANIIPPIGFHALRHTWASLAIMSGMPLMIVAKQLGHSTTKMVEAHYGHLAETYVDAVIKQHGPRFGV